MWDSTSKIIDIGCLLFTVVVFLIFRFLHFHFWYKNKGKSEETGTIVRSTVQELPSTVNSKRAKIWDSTSKIIDIGCLLFTVVVFLIFPFLHFHFWSKNKGKSEETGTIVRCTVQELPSTVNSKRAKIWDSTSKIIDIGCLLFTVVVFSIFRFLHFHF